MRRMREESEGSKEEVKESRIRERKEERRKRGLKQR